jgi:tryptophan synthase beta chain
MAVKTPVSTATKGSPVKLSELPDDGHFGDFGGQFVPEILLPALKELESAYKTILAQPEFHSDLKTYRTDYGGRPTPLYFAKRLTQYASGARIFLKREDLAHSGAHALNSTIGQALLARQMGKNRVIAETGSGQHGVATAMACALLGLRAEIYMGARDIDRQSINVQRMKLLGARVHPVSASSQGLKDAMNEAWRDWVTHVPTTYYLISSAIGPHPYPMIVRDFQRVIGDEIKGQLLRREQRLPDVLVASVSEGAAALGTFFPFADDDRVQFLGVEAAGAAPLGQGSVGVLHGAKTYLLQDEHGQIQTTQSIAVGLDYPAAEPEHALYKKVSRAEYTAITDAQALEGFALLAQLEGILAALEPAHAVFAGIARARRMKPDQIVVITLSDSGDKDLTTVLNYARSQ